MTFFYGTQNGFVYKQHFKVWLQEESEQFEQYFSHDHKFSSVNKILLKSYYLL